MNAEEMKYADTVFAQSFSGRAGMSAAAGESKPPASKSQNTVSKSEINPLK
jgi:hypothetical protein